MIVKKKEAIVAKRRNKFLSFRERVDRIKIDPLRKSKRQDELDGKETESYLHVGLQKWKDLSTSAAFVQFNTDASPIAQSLPQVMYHKSEIFNYLESAILIQDRFGLQPLLDLLVQFAHDLGPVFEEFFPRTVGFLITVASHEELEVVEWTFNCMAYLFKYLYRSLSTKLLDTFDLICPLFSQHERRPYLARFAAESFSYFVRNAKSVDFFIPHIFEKRSELNSKGFDTAMTVMLAEAMKGPDSTLHSRAARLSTRLHEYCLDTSSESNYYIFLDVLTDVLHHVNHETSTALYHSSLKFLKSQLQSTEISPEIICMITKELVLLVGLRKGSRVPSWVDINEIYDLLASRLTQFDNSSSRDLATWEFCKLAQEKLQFYPDLEESEVTKVIDSVFNLFNGEYFIPFSDLSLEFSNANDHFKILSLYMQRFLEKSVSLDGYSFMALTEIAQHPSISVQGTKLVKSHILQYLQSAAGFFNKNDYSDGNDILILESTVDLALSLLGSTKDLCEPSVRLFMNLCQNASSDLLIGISGKLLSLISGSVDPRFDNNLITAILTACKSQWDTLSRNSSFIFGFTKFYKAAATVQADLNQLDIYLTENLHKNLKSADPKMRLATLKLLGLLMRTDSDYITEMLNLCLKIEETPFEVSTVRNITMNIRRIVIDFPGLENKNFQKYMINYVFGLIKSPFQPIWQEASITFSKIVSGHREDAWNLIFDSIVEDSKPNLEIEEDFSLLEPCSAYDFKCTTVQNLEDIASRKIIKKNQWLIYIAKCQRQARFVSKVDHKLFRHRCFDVLMKIDRLAESHSHSLIPIFHSCAHAFGPQKPLLIDLLKLFAMFNRPAKTLSEGDVYYEITRLLANPDSEIQKLALSCIFAWGNASINLYRDHLENLLGGQAYRDELSKLVSSNAEDSVISAEHEHYVVPLIINILYGCAVGYSGNSTKAKASNRKAIISAIGSLSESYIRLFVDLAADGVPPEILLDFDSEELSIPNYSQIEISQGMLRRIVGFMTMAEDILDILKGKIGETGDILLRYILSCIEFCRLAGREGNMPIEHLSALRNGRSLGFKCLSVLFQKFPEIDWQLYQDFILSEIIRPRMDHFNDENSQEVSPIMKLFLIASQSNELIHYLAADNSLVLAVNGLLDSTTKDVVLLAAIQFMTNLMDIQTGNARDNIKEVARNIVKSNMSTFLPRFVRTLSSSRNTEVVQSGISALRKIISLFNRELIEDEFLLEQYVEMCMTGVTSWKNNALFIADVFEVLSVLVKSLKNNILLRKCYGDLCPLLQTVRERHTRTALINIFVVIDSKCPDIGFIGELLQKLNSYAAVRIDEYNYESRFETYAAINTDLWKTFSVIQWTPLLHDSIFCLANYEDIALKRAASSTLQRFIQVTEKKAMTEDLDRVEFYSLMELTLVPGIRLGLRLEPEIPRYEYINILKLLVQKSLAFPTIKNLEVLLKDGDEEADFFSNIVHIQSHRRQRAIYRLGQTALVNDLGDFNIAHFLLPILEHFLHDVTQVTINMAEEAISTIGKLCLNLSMNQYQAVVRRSVINLDKSPDKVRFFTRLLDSVSEAIYLRSQFSEEQKNTIQPRPYNLKKMDQFLSNEIIPRLHSILRQANDNNLNSVVGIAVPMIKFLCGTSQENMEKLLSTVILELSHHLKHRLQDIRDAVRKTISRICILVGLKHLNLILDRMKSVLVRGSHKHILAFSVHSFLVALMTADSSLVAASLHGSLDNCVRAIADIGMDDIFGISGSEKDAEEYRSKVIEVKERKSYDSFEILAINISITKLDELILPIRRILQNETITLRMERKINDLLRRISNGLAKNEEGNTHQVIEYCLRICQEKPEESKKASELISEREKRFLLTKRARIARNTVENLHFIQRFALDVIKNCLRKNRQLVEGFELQEFVQSFGPFLRSEHEDIQLSSLRLLTTAAKYSSLLEKLDTRFLFTYVVGLIQSSTSTISETCQTGLKLLATLIQKKQYTKDDERSIGYIVEKIQLDFVEPDKQAHSFAFIKSLLQQRIKVPELYDAADKIREIMVNSQLKSTREVCKSLYCMFLLEFPQGPKRMSKQMRFLIHNLDYPHASGRETVLEVVYVLLSKGSSAKSEVVQTIVELFFIPLIMTMVNDDSEDCKEMALLLFRSIAQKSSVANLTAMEKSCSEWLQQGESPALVDAATKVSEILNSINYDLDK
ncbi:uncharacterized protein V1516DRAFT_712612 [Lipomyces oligophaga]|uniref:uncharacterized protein n=1 Tax=Lipomyces oligophaga TaxID=45792 RepID=UPI0034CFC76B